jgi:hypothetical protein
VDLFDLLSINKTVCQAYNFYTTRWLIETAYEALKLVFGLTEGHIRQELHVLDHFKLVYFRYQTYLKFKRKLKKPYKMTLTVRQLAVL